MANYSAQASYKIKDYLGVETSHLIDFVAPEATTITQLQTFVSGYTPVLDAIIDGQIILLTLSLDMNIAGAKSSPVVGNPVEQTGLFNFSQSGVTRKFGIDVPSIANEVIANGKVDLSNADVTAWKDWITAAHSGISVVSAYLLDLVALIDVLLSFRKKRKALNRRSFENAS